MNDLQVVAEFTEDQKELIKETICKGASDDETKLFLYQAAQYGLDPLKRQIYSVARWDSKLKKNVRTTQVSIDGFRVMANRTGLYAGQTEPMWCGEDGIWVDVWLSKEPPKAAKVGVYRKDFKAPLVAVALWESYVQKFYKNGSWEISPMWRKMPDVMLSKVAESLAFRKAFPETHSGVYTTDEMAQAENTEPREVVEQKKPEKRTSKIDGKEVPNLAPTKEELDFENTFTIEENRSDEEYLPPAGNLKVRALSSPTKQQLRELRDLVDEMGWPFKYVSAYINSKFGKYGSVDLNQTEYVELYDFIMNTPLTDELKEELCPEPTESYMDRFEKVKKARQQEQHTNA